MVRLRQLPVSLTCPGFGRDVESACCICRPRNRRKTSLWGLLDRLYERVCPSCGAKRAAETARELLATAAMEEKGFRPGLVAVVQTFGDRANCHPHVHALVTRGVWTEAGQGIPVPYVDERAAEELFRHKVLGLLRRRPE